MATNTLTLHLHCGSCYYKVKKILCKFHQIRDQVFDQKTNTVTITVFCCDIEKFRAKLWCKGSDFIRSIVIPEKMKEPVKPKEPGKPEPESQLILIELPPCKKTENPPPAKKPNEPESKSKDDPKPSSGPCPCRMRSGPSSCCMGCCNRCGCHGYGCSPQFRLPHICYDGHGHAYLPRCMNYNACDGYPNDCSIM